MNTIRYQKYLDLAVEDCVHGLSELFGILRSSDIHTLQNNKNFEEAVLLLQDALNCWERLVGVTPLQDSHFWNGIQKSILGAPQVNPGAFSASPPEETPEKKETSPATSRTPGAFPKNGILKYIGKNPLISPGRSVRQLAPGMLVVQSAEGRIQVDPNWVVPQDQYEAWETEPEAADRLASTLPEEILYEPSLPAGEASPPQDVQGALDGSTAGASFPSDPSPHAYSGPPSSPSDPMAIHLKRAIKDS